MCTKTNKLIKQINKQKYEETNQSSCRILAKPKNKIRMCAQKLTNSQTYETNKQTSKETHGASSTNKQTNKQTNPVATYLPSQKIILYK